ncbi:DNA ligase D [Salinicola socius]|uniref:DNA ligase (ATP) n=1 Tax=Salinicola socius TaxID=404433 RepID=A0A1Q8SUJ4_9GAMM|nr:DNA ligase D [Salinicola socius]OLO05068.1 DNA ligase D [Salinicola socius]
MADLETYRQKRDFSRSPEPRGKRGRKRSQSSFVIHKHDASQLHYDLRLEEGGVLRSWALPKGPSLEPGEKHLAVQVEDHPLDYGDFEGVIPEGYGAGTVMIWDRGVWRITGKHDDDQIDFALDGDKLKGAWTLKRMGARGGNGKPRDGKQWLMIKRHDDAGAQVPDSLDDISVVSDRDMAAIAEAKPATSSASSSSKKDAASGTSCAKKASSVKVRGTRSSGGRKAKSGPLIEADKIDGARKASLPAHPSAQLATLVEKAPRDDDWFHEIKFDGYRILARLDHGKVSLLTRNGHDWRDRFPEIAEAIEGLPLEKALFDGEIVALRRDGVSDFRRLQQALGEEKSAGLTYQIFDLRYLEEPGLDGVVLDDVKLRDRKALLAQLCEAVRIGNRGMLRYTDHIEGQGEAFYEQASRQGLEGIVSKRADALYRGRRNRDWLKTKTEHQAEFVVGGYTDPQGSRSGFGSLLIGAYDDDGKLRYCGRVGAGFSHDQLTTWQWELSRSPRKTSPFVERDIPDLANSHWVTPKRVIDVTFGEWTRDGRLRHPRFRGVREDRDPADIRLSQQQTAERPMNDGSSETAGGKRRSPAVADNGEIEIEGVRLTHPDRVLFEDAGITKRALAEFYAEHAEWILPGLAERPLTLLRCPGGVGKECFVQKHPGETMPDDLPSVAIAEKSGTHDYLYARSAADLVALVQMGTLEFHLWNSRIDDLERPDQLVFDLDPAPDCEWQAVIDVARELRQALAELELTAFLRTTGGKGLHLVVPLKPHADWETAKAFAEAVCERCAERHPDQLTLNMSKQARHGKVLLDYLRNGRGATAVASYSVRARPGAPVATPIRWADLGPKLSADRYTLANLPRRLASLKRDPWAGFDDARQRLTKKRCRDVGMEI